VAAFVDHLTPFAVSNPAEADYIVGFSNRDEWSGLDYASRSSQVVYVCIERFGARELYDAFVTCLPNAVFLHGEEGLQELGCLLEEAGVLETGCEADPLAEDVFLKMRGEYLLQLEGEIEPFFSKTGRAFKEAFTELLGRVAGAAGTYEFEKISDVAVGAVDKLDEGKSLDHRRLLEALNRAISDERDAYNRQVEECLPSVVELDVRQRVLVLTDDEPVAQQLQFALSHSRMETTWHANPADVLDILSTLQPDILVIQQGMRNFDGLDIAAYVRNTERYQSLPILALLRETGEASVTRAVRAGVDTWLTIPFSAANVALSVLNLLQRVEVARKLGGRDGLTGLYTKEAMVDRLTEDLARVARSGQQLAVMLIHLKDTASPRLDFLELAEVAKRVFRRSDLLARYNESTLAVVLPGIDGRIVVSIFNRFRRVLGDQLTVEVATTIASGSVTAESLMADVEIRLTRTLGGSIDASLGVFEADETQAQRAAPRILIADTDEAIVNLLRFFCAREGFEVDDVRNGTDVLNYLEKQHARDNLPELLVMEAFLPGVDGFQILERVQTEYGGRVAVIMLSVRPSEERVANAFKLGAIDFIAKPFRVPEMVARIRSGLTRTHAV
jgi:PleD family two-component response regulator